MDSYRLALLSQREPNCIKCVDLKDIDISACVPDEPMLLKSGYTSLHFSSVLEDNLEFTKLLLTRGANSLKQGTFNGRTPLLEFINERPYNCNRQAHKLFGKLGKNPIVDLLLSEQVERKDATNPRCFQTGMSHLHVACIVNHWQAVEMFLQAGESVNQAISSDKCCWTPLHLAVKYSAVGAAKSLIYYGANIHLKDTSGWSPLHRLIDRIFEIVDHLNLGKSGPTSPMPEELKRLEKIVTFILKARKKNEQNFVDDIGLSTLHVACTLRGSYMVEDMLEGELDVNAQISVDANMWPGWTPLHFAACCSVDSVKLLMQNGADLMKGNVLDDSPLNFCAKRYSPRILHSILATKEEFQSIVMSDGSTRLLDLILAMDDCEEFKKLENVDLQVPSDSPIWPGCNVLHMAILMHERYFDPRGYLRLFVDLRSSSNDIITEQLTCTEEEEKSYWKRIVVCLARRCSISTKNAAGRTPLHLAFYLSKANVVDKLLNCCNAGNEVNNDGVSFLHIACALGKTNVVKRFVDDKSTPTINEFCWNRVRLPGRSTPLHIATAFQQREVVEYLLQCGADMHARDAMGFTPIHLAMTSTAPLFLGRSDLKEVSSDGLSHLHVAAASNDERAIELLVRRGTIDVNSLFEPRQSIDFLKLYYGRTPLHVAVEGKCLNAVDALIQAGADIHLSAAGWRYNTPLQGAMADQPNDLLTTMVKKLRRDKRSKGPIEECGVTLLHFACAIFDSRWMKRLLDKGADPNARVCADHDYDWGWKGCTAMHVLLMMASRAKTRPKNLVDMVNLLLRHEADVAIVRGDGLSPVMMAERLAEEAEEREKREKSEAEKKKEEKKSTETNEEKMSTILLSIADLLLNHQQSYAINPSTPFGRTHFHFACKRNNLQIVRKFLANGTNPNHSTHCVYTVDGGYTPLHFSFKHNALEVAWLLLDRGADVRVADAYGNTPMHVAAKYNVDDVELLEAMSSLSADVKAENFEVMTPLDMLARSDNVSYDELRFFLDRGCKIDVERDPESVGLLLINANPRDLQLILELLFDSCDLIGKIRSGYNVMNSLVAVSPVHKRWTVDMYVGAIHLFIIAGCKLEQKDTLGRTVIHHAVASGNTSALEALFILGADINTTFNETGCANDGHPKLDKSDANRFWTVIARHVWKMKFIGLEIDPFVETTVKRKWGTGYLDMNIEQRCEEELARIARTKIIESWTLRDLLHSDLQLHFGYVCLPLAERRRIDEVFADHRQLREQFPEFCGLLTMKYREMHRHAKMYWPMGNAVTTLLKLEVPDNCFKFFCAYLAMPLIAFSAFGIEEY